MPRFIKKLELSHPPASLWPDFDKQINPAWTNRPRTCTKNKEIIENCRYSRFDISTELKNWIDSTITKDYKNIGLSYMFDGAVNLPHTDHTRDATMIYLFDTGGSNVETKFWQRRDFPIHHKNADESYHYNLQQPTTYNDLDLIYTEVLSTHIWYILDARCIHSVEGMQSPRISLQLGFFKNSDWAQQIFGADLEG